MTATEPARADASTARAAAFHGNLAIDALAAPTRAIRPRVTR
jgi:hypothetical protein